MVKKSWIKREKMDMSKVYFLKDFKKLSSIKIKKLFKGFYLSNSEVLVKIHFGEPGNKFTFTPKKIRPIVETMKSLKLNPIFIDTPVTYSSPRNSIEGYIRTVKEKEYDKLAPFIISNNGIKVKTKDFTAGVCKELVEAKNVLVISHVKGHVCAGFGGAVKNLGMGGVTKETKSIEHILGQPKFISECRGCGICANLCPAGAIKIVNGKAQINLDKCFGCSICQLKCPYKCLIPKKTYFDDLLAQGAAAVINNLPQCTFYINFVTNITKWCDCEVDPGELISEDIGILFSDNPIAIDKASIDLVNKLNGRDLFKEINKKDPLLHVKFASEYTKRELKYKLIPL
jgi:uncharacterized Fe-S center protein